MNRSGRDWVGSRIRIGFIHGIEVGYRERFVKDVLDFSVIDFKIGNFPSLGKAKRLKGVNVGLDQSSLMGLFMHMIQGTCNIYKGIQKNDLNVKHSSL